MTGDDIFQVARIAPAGADTVYGLVAMLHPEVTPEGWAAFVRGNSQDGTQPRGVFALSDARAVPHAVFAFRVAPTLEGGTALEISELAMLRLPGTCLVHALLRFANELAIELNLPRIAISLERSAAWPQDHDALRRQGFQVERMMVLGRARLSPAACN
ncbi:hypothetical protein [Bosea sp. (in: a-proteobacteria)]|uniref:hypothetical protein n=1 Tax=Bosea sp. (in: a-proteobacteria) TaxID=1871050 RepID=UPI002626288F|nr:hypothetical protein [Bosea sp. (in: a-proteobacteria)]MCO5090694.1 hypothetical protein [Bosea sp. (in: a-proteobacteria)]